MTYIVKDECIKCKLTDCVEVCPVDCFYEGENMLVINPDECIDCGVCEPECPINAIVADTACNEKDKDKWLLLNKKYSGLWPNITKKKEPMLDHEKFKDIKDKKNKQKKIAIKKAKPINKVKTLNEPKAQAQLKLVNKNTYTPEEKIEIKKIKKQATEKRLYEVKDFVVYPKHGVGKIVSVEKATIGQIDIQFYKIFVEKEKLTLTVPINQQTNLRPISTINQINKCISILKTKPKIKRTMWSRRAQEYDQKINSGKIYELAEVVKDLNKNSDIIADQSYSERQLFEKAYERLKSEFEAVLKISPEEVQKKMDKALGRNQIISEEA